MESTNISDKTTEHQPSNSSALTGDQKIVLLQSIVEVSKSCLNIPYDTEPGAPVVWTGRGKWTDLLKPPKTLDCSGLAAGSVHKVGLKFPDGAQAQFNFTVGTTTPRPGDFAFFADDKDITHVHHVGIVYDSIYIIEARGYDPKASFETGKVILRPRMNWERYEKFVGYRAHPKLA